MALAQQHPHHQSALPFRSNICSLPPPEVLRQLPNLRALALTPLPHTVSEGQVNAVFEAVPQLTALSLRFPPPLPRAVAGLAQLQRFSWDAISELQLAHFALPDGPWLANLQQAALPGDVAVRNLHVLRGTAQLEYLGLHSLPALGSPLTSKLVELVLEHPTLRCLQLSGWPGVCQAVAAATTQRSPGLSVSYVHRCNDMLLTILPELVDYIWNT